MSKTPRTDAEAVRFGRLLIDKGTPDAPKFETTQILPADFARMLEEELAQAKREVRFLRFYGNKDCTAMADEAIEYLRAK